MCLIIKVMNAAIHCDGCHDSTYNRDEISSVELKLYVE